MDTIQEYFYCRCYSAALDWSCKWKRERQNTKTNICIYYKITTFSEQIKTIIFHLAHLAEFMPLTRKTKNQKIVFISCEWKKLRELSTHIADYRSIKIKYDAWHICYQVVGTTIFYDKFNQELMLDNNCFLKERDLTGWRWAVFVIVFQQYLL